MAEPIRTFAQTITDAVADFATFGYDSEERLERWLAEIRLAAERDLVPESVLEQGLRDTFGAVYRRQVEAGGLLRTHAVDRYTLERVKPHLRAELDRRILASAQLIRSNREQAIAETLRRFSGWATSIPVGGDEDLARRPVKSDIRKALASLPFVERRCAIDQGQKFAANLSDILATDGGAIAFEWEHHYVRYPRPEHVARHGKFYLIRDSWAHKAGLVRPGKSGYSDEVSRPGIEILCRCTARYAYSISRLPPEMLTAKGAAELARVRTEMAA